VTKIVEKAGYACKSLGKSAWSGFIHHDNITDPEIKSLQVGVVLNAKIIKIEYENLSVKLSLPRKIELITEKEALDRIYAPYRPHFKVDLLADASFSGTIDLKDRFGPGNKYKKRTEFASFPKFKNITLKDALQILAESPNRGAFIIRPSPQGDNYLNLTIKYYKNQYVHIEIKETKKADSVTFEIGDQAFGSLAELEIRYIKEFNKRVMDAVNCKKFVH